MVRSGVRAGIFGAAGFLGGCEFHEFDARVIGIVEIELPFAVAADLGLFAAGPTVFDKLLPSGFDVRDTQSDVIHHAEGVMVGAGWDVEHVFDPVGAVGDLHVHPTGFVVFPSAVPIDVEAEDVFVAFESRPPGGVPSDGASGQHARHLLQAIL